jgi:hypothetical protein
VIHLPEEEQKAVRRSENGNKIFKRKIGCTDFKNREVNLDPLAAV